MPTNLALKAQRAFFTLCASFSLTACSTPCREWQLQQIATCYPCFNSGRLLLPPECDNSRLELEFVRSSSGIRLYLNILFLQAPPCIEDPSRTKVDVIFEEETRPIYPYILQGGQRLLLTNEDRDWMIQSLLEDCSFTIKFGRHEIRVIPDAFAKAYLDLMALPIEEVLPIEEEACCSNDPSS